MGKLPTIIIRAVAQYTELLLDVAITPPFFTITEEGGLILQEIG